MGKALIVSGGQDGLYTIKPIRNRVRLDAEIARLEALLEQINERLAEIEVDLLVAEVDVLDARDALNAIIDAAAAVGEIPDSNELRAATADLLEASKVRDLLKIDRDMEKARVLETQSLLRRLGAVPLDQNQQAWCADYTEDLADEVATAEIPGEGSARIIIRPGFEGRADYVPSRDGQLFHRTGQSPEQVYFNAAVLPGWQKFHPTYRVGVINAVDQESNTASVSLDEETSSAYGLAINQFTALTGVPVEYMGCNSLAFGVGDRVLVEFSGRHWLAPKVIGFETEPKMCNEWLAAYWEKSSELTRNIYWFMPATTFEEWWSLGTTCAEVDIDAQLFIPDQGWFSFSNCFKGEYVFGDLDTNVYREFWWENEQTTPGGSTLVGILIRHDERQLFDESPVWINIFLASAPTGEYEIKISSSLETHFQQKFWLDGTDTLEVTGEVRTPLAAAKKAGGPVASLPITSVGASIVPILPG